MKKQKYLSMSVNYIQYTLANPNPRYPNGRNIEFLVSKYELSIGI